MSFFSFCPIHFIKKKKKSKCSSKSSTKQETHYADLKSKSFFNGLIDYMSMGPVVCMVWEGDNVVKTGRVMLGATNPRDSAPGTIRGDLCIHVGRNICHGSDSVEAAKKEIALWFPEGLNTYSDHSEKWVYEKVEEVTESSSSAKEEVSTKVVESDEYDEYKCYDDDAIMGKNAPSLQSLDYVQGAATKYSEKPTVVLFWAKFLKWQVYPAMKACEALHQSGIVNVVGVATDPKRSAIERHIEKNACPTTYALCFDESNGSPGGQVKNIFKKNNDGELKIPHVFLVDTKGKVVWHQAFTAGNPYEKSNFDDQVKLFCKTGTLKMNGPAPTSEESSEEEEEDAAEGGAPVVDPLSADVDW